MSWKPEEGYEKKSNIGTLNASEIEYCEAPSIAAGSLRAFRTSKPLKLQSVVVVVVKMYKQVWWHCIN